MSALLRESRLQLMKDNLISLQQRYGELLKSARMGTAAQQQMGELQSSVLSAGMVRSPLRPWPCTRADRAPPSCDPSLAQLQSIENLLQLINELRRAALLGQARARAP